MGSHLLEQAMVGLNVEARSDPPEDVRVPAGLFRGCAPGTRTISFMGMSRTSEVWTHGAVPFSGVVTSRAGDGSTAELVGFGTLGARSVF